MNPTWVMHDLVTLGPEACLDDFVILGRPPKGATPGALPLVIGRNAVIRSHAVLYAGSHIGDNFQCGHGALIREHCDIGNDCSVGSGSVLEFQVRMGHRVRLHSRCFVPEHTLLEDDCWLGPGVVITNARYPRAARTKETLQGVRVCKHAIVGAHATLLPGILIGEGSLVGAGSVVTQDVPPGMVVAGNPARVRGLRKDLRHQDTGLPVYSDDPYTQASSLLAKERP